MGQKVNPIGFRLGVNKTWSSKWYVDPKEYAETLHEDLQRFRFENNGSDGTDEILYGDENAASFGLAQYSVNGESTLRYTTETGDGAQAVLLLRYTMNLLDEITIYIQ